MRPGTGREGTPSGMTNLASLSQRRLWACLTAVALILSAPGMSAAKPDETPAAKAKQAAKPAAKTIAKPDLKAKPAANPAGKKTPPKKTETKAAAKPAGKLTGKPEAKAAT